MKIFNKIKQWLESSRSDRPLLIILIILLNLVSIRGFFRLDLTAQKSFSLSKASKQLVKNIEQPLSVKVFFSDNLPSPYNFVSQYLKDILIEYKANANSNFSYTFYDMSKDENIKIASSFGLGPVQVEQALTTELSLKSVWMGIAVTYGDSIKTIGAVKSSSDLEYKITTMLSGMISVTDSLLAMEENKKLEVLLYYPEKLKSYPIGGYKELLPAVNKAFETVNAKYYNKLNLTVIDPKESEVDAAIAKYGLPAIHLEPEQINTTMGLLIENGPAFTMLPVRIAQTPFGNSITNISSLNENLEDALEFLMTNTMEIGYICNHNENPLNPSGYGQQQNNFSSVNLSNTLSDIYNLEQIDLSQNEFIPQTLKTVIVNNPKTEFSQQELYALDQFLLSGGNIIYFTPGLDEASLEQGISVAPQNGLEKLLNSYGIKISQDMVMDSNCYTQLSREYGKLNMNWAPVIKKENLDRKNPVTQFLANVIFYAASSIDIEQALQNENLKTTVLAKTSDKSWVVTDNIILYPGYIQQPEDKELLSSRNVAVLLEGKFNSAFGENYNNSTAQQLQASNHLAKSVVPGKVIVISSGLVSTDMLVDQDGSTPVALFIRNCVDYANGLSDYCAMRTKNSITNFLTISSQKSADLVKFLNQFGLSLVILLIGFVVYRAKLSKKQKIHDKYNPNDTRTVIKGEPDND